MTDRPITHEVHDRVARRVAEGERPTDAIRAVADEMGRTVSATSSAYYVRARAAGRTETAGHQRQAERHDAVSLYREMLPLVEAGASPRQAARRFGAEDEDAGAIATGFERWLARETGETTGDGDLSTAPTAEQDRLIALTAENRVLRRELTLARQALTRVRAIVDGAIAGD